MCICNKIFCIAFLGIYGVYAPKRTASVAFGPSTSMPSDPSTSMAFGPSTSMASDPSTSMPSCSYSSMPSGSSIDNEVREARAVNLGEDSLVGVSHVSSFKQEIMKKITKLELENSVLRGELTRLKKRVDDMLPRRESVNEDQDSDSSMENEARTVNIKNDDLVSVSRASSLEEEILQRVTKLELENSVLKGDFVRFRQNLNRLHYQCDFIRGMLHINMPV